MASVPSSPAANPEPEEPNSPVDAQYKGFGSFHSDNVQDLVELPDGQYQAPTLPSFAPTLAHTGDATPQSFGAAFRKHFLLDPSWTFINHGAFGGALKGALEIKHRYEELMESQPLSFVDRQLLPLLVYSVRCLASFLGASPTDIALVTNATFGLNAAIFGLVQSNDVVCYLDSEYGSVWRMMLECSKRTGAALKEMPLYRHLTDPSVLGTPEGITKYVEDHLPAGCTVFVVDHISSNGAFELPIFTHIIPMLRRNGVKHIIVDGAHGPLQCHIDFRSLPKIQRPTVYVGNLHKWTSCPKSVGFIWCHDPKVKTEIRTPTVSHGFGSGFLSEFIWNGTSDYGAHLTLPAVLEFWTRVGITKVREYCATLLHDALALLHRDFGTAPLPLHAPCMALVRLPERLQGGRLSPKFIQDALHYHHSVEVPVKQIDGILYLRISTFVYNTIEDYAAVSRAVLAIVPPERKRVREGDTQPTQNHPSTPSPSHPPHNNVHNDRGCGVGGLGPARNVVAFEESSEDEQ